jgi:PKD repeat protein
MRQICLLLAGFFCGFLSFAQTSTNQVSFTYSINTTYNVVTFNNTSVLQPDSLRRAFWHFGNGAVGVTGALAGITYAYNAPGTYQVCLKIYKYNPANAADSVLIGAQCKSVTLQSTCAADFFSRDSINSGGLRLMQFTAAPTSNTNSGIKEICWNFGDGTDTCIQATSATAVPLTIVYGYAASGSYNVCLRVKYNNGCVAEKCKTVTIATPTIGDSCSANFTVGPVSATPLGRKFFAQVGHNKGKKPVRICWTFGNGKDTCIQYPANYTGDYWVEHKYAQYGQYEVCVNIKYEGGCEKKKCNLIQVNAPAPPQDSCMLQVSEAAVNIASMERKFYVGLMPNRTAEKICWTFGDGTDTCIVLANPLNAQQLVVTHRYPAPGTYTVCAKVFYEGGCVVQRCRPVTISLPHTNICGGYFTDSAMSANTIRFKANAILAPTDNVVSYGWLFGDGTSATGQTVNHTYNATGRYNVCLVIRTRSGCETKICKPLNVAGNNQPQLILTPNPVTTVLNATFHSTHQQQVTIKIFNANGIMVKSYVRNAVVGANNWTFSDVATLPTGVYSVIVQSGNQLATAIFFKQ